MKRNFLKAGLLLLTVTMMINQADAQRRGKRTRAAGTETQQQSTEQQNDNKPPSNYDPYGGLPIRVDSSGLNGEKVNPSLRNDNAFDKSSLNQRTPLTYEHLRWDDALFAKKVWRELDLREKLNQSFRYESVTDQGSQMFVDILLRAVLDGQVTAFEDDRFSSPLTLDKIVSLTSGKTDTVEERDINDINKVKGYVVTRSSFDPKSVSKLRIKEEWVFDRESSRMFVRILGIGVLKTEYFPNTTKERGTSSMFWVYYPDLRPTLARVEVYNPKNMGQARMTWEELFESRMFSSYIVKSTIDNASNKMIRNVIKDPILQLIEGDNIKEKIFNYEQDLWSY
ncbi:MAG: gliding motility protein GldN [Chitinophagaceae bacterium]|nr:MAG: gliding motility protein GldN [Chitinophagaceae bacterium]